MSARATQRRIDALAPGLGALLAKYTEALGAFAKAQGDLQEFMSDKPEVRRRFELVGEIAQTTGHPLTEEEILEVLLDK